MSQSKPQILFLHTIPEQKTEWLKILNIEEIELNIESENTDIADLFENWHQNQIKLPDLALIDISAKTPNGHFFQVSALSRWCKSNQLSVLIFALNGIDENISTFQENWAKYQGLNGVFPKLNANNLVAIVSKLNKILGANIFSLVEKKLITLPTKENENITAEKINNDSLDNDSEIKIAEEIKEINEESISWDVFFREKEITIEEEINIIDKDIIYLENSQKIEEEKVKVTEEIPVILPINDLESLNQAITNDPSSADVFCQRGDFYSSQGNEQNALQDYQTAIKLNSKSEKGFLGRGHILIRLGDYPNAINDLNKVIKFNPRNAFAYHYRGLALFRSGDERGAKKDYDRAIKLKPDFSQAYNDRGFLLYFSGNTNQALQDYTQAINYQPDYADAYYNRGNIYSDLGRFEEAIADYNNAIRCNPKLALAYGNRGIAYYELDQVEEAIKDTTISAKLFYEQGDLQSYQQAMDTLKQMQ